MAIVLMGILQIFVPWYSLSNAVKGENNTRVKVDDFLLWQKTLRQIIEERDRWAGPRSQPPRPALPISFSFSWYRLQSLDRDEKEEEEKLRELYILKAFPSPVSPPTRFGACIGNVYKFKIFVFNKGPAFTFWSRFYILVEHLKRKLPLFKLRNFSNPTQVSNSKRRHSVLYTDAYNITSSHWPPFVGLHQQCSVCVLYVRG